MGFKSKVKHSQCWIQLKSGPGIITEERPFPFKKCITIFFKGKRMSFFLFFVVLSFSLLSFLFLSF